jgi:hypothetical protein
LCGGVATGDGAREEERDEAEGEGSVRLRLFLNVPSLRFCADPAVSLFGVSCFFDEVSVGFSRPLVSDSDAVSVAVTVDVDALDGRRAGGEALP